MPIIKKIYLDMDGVIADFYHTYQEMFDITMDEIEANRSRKNYWKYWQDFIDNRGFELLPQIRGSEKLLDFLNETKIPVEILSSSGGVHNHEKVKEQKINWLIAHNINYVPNIVSGKKNKKLYATPDSLLIDDTEQNISDFREAGGYAIFHKSVEDTIDQLKELLYRWDGVIR
jgi:hypothetical protein